MDVLEVNVLVVGGGFAGTSAARHLSRRGLNVALVDAKSYFEFTPSALRGIVEPNAIRNSTLQRPSGRNKQRNVTGIVTSLDKNKAVVEIHCHEASTSDRLAVHFEYCIWAGGSGYEEPIKPSVDAFQSVNERWKETNAAFSRVRSAKQ